MPTRNSQSSRKRNSRQRTETRYFTRTVLCTICGVSEHQLSIWEREELLTPVGVSGPETLYDNSAFERVRLIRTLAEELEVNVPGISVILNLLDNMAKHV